MHRLTDQLFSIDVGGKEIMLKEYCFGTNCKQGFYLIDSNILIAMGNLYYKGNVVVEVCPSVSVDRGNTCELFRLCQVVLSLYVPS